MPRSPELLLLDSQLIEAAKKGDTNLATKLLKKGANVNASDEDDAGDEVGDYTPLTYAAYYGHTEMVQLLIQYGADVNAAVGADNETPLHVAAGSGREPRVGPRECYVNIAKLLLKEGANVNALGGE